MPTPGSGGYGDDCPGSGDGLYLAVGSSRTDGAGVTWSLRPPAKVSFDTSGDEDEPQLMAVQSMLSGGDDEEIFMYPDDLQAVSSEPAEEKEQMDLSSFRPMAAAMSESSCRDSVIRVQTDASWKERRSGASMDEYLVTVVMDIGRHMAKVGLAHEMNPRSIFPTGARAPGQGGGDDMESIWRTVFTRELDVDPKDTHVLLTLPYGASKRLQERWVQILFEVFDVPALLMVVPGVLSLLASGRRSGLAVDLGESGSYLVPIYEATPIAGATRRAAAAGRDLTEFMVQMLSKNHYKQMKPFPPLKLHEIGRNAKETFGIVSQDFAADFAAGSSSKSLSLPDGHVVVLDREPIQCAEALFSPALLSKPQELGLSQQVSQAIANCDVDLHWELFSNVVLAGGGSLFPGLRPRLASELLKLAPAAVGVRVEEPEERRHSAWTGGALLATLPGFWDMCFTQEEYEEYGPSALHRSSMNPH